MLELFEPKNIIMTTVIGTIAICVLYTLIMTTYADMKHTDNSSHKGKKVNKPNKANKTTNNQ